MLQQPQDVYDRVRRKIGVLARRHEMELTAPTEDDEVSLQAYLEDSLSELAVETERYRKEVTVRTSTNAFVPRPDFVHHLHVAQIHHEGEAFDLDVTDGRDVATWSRRPNPETGRPTKIGAFGERLYLWPVPDQEYLIDMLCSLNGSTGSPGSAPVETETSWFFLRPTQLFPFGSTSSASGPSPPTLGRLLGMTPRELHKAVVAYVTAEWLIDIGEPEIAADPEQRFETDLRDYDQEPIEPSTGERDYNPLGL